MIPVVNSRLTQGGRRGGRDDVMLVMPPPRQLSPGGEIMTAQVY
jgi:hypothetical protein